MTANQLIKQLQAMVKKHGNVNISVYFAARDTHLPIQALSREHPTHLDHNDPYASPLAIEIACENRNSP